MKSKILFTCFVIVAIVAAVSGYSKSMTDKPIIPEIGYVALYDGMIYYQKSSGHTMMDETFTYFEAYMSLIDSRAVVAFKLEKGSPTFCMVYTPGPAQAIDGIGWIDDNCDGSFNVFDISDEAVIPECYKED